MNYSFSLLFFSSVFFCALCHNIYGSSEMTIINGCPVSQKLRCGMLKNPHCSMAMSAEYGSKFAAFIGTGDISI